MCIVIERVCPEEQETEEEADGRLGKRRKDAEDKMMRPQEDKGGTE